MWQQTEIGVGSAICLGHANSGPSHTFEFEVQRNSSIKQSRLVIALLGRTTFLLSHHCALSELQTECLEINLHNRDEQDEENYSYKEQSQAVVRKGGSNRVITRGWLLLL